jgi:hypothetical protein
MNFIKSIWNKVKSFFGGMFASKKVAAVPAAPAVKTEVAQAAEVINAEEVQAEADAKAEAAQRREELAIVFNRVAELARFRNYSLEEARAAFYADDMVTMVRIERDMKARKYKAPKKVKAVKQAVAA